MRDERLEVVFDLLVQNAIRSFFGIEATQNESEALEKISLLEYENAYQLLDSRIRLLSNYIERFSVIEYRRIQCLNPDIIDIVGLKKELLQLKKSIARKVPYYLSQNVSVIETEEKDEYAFVASALKYGYKKIRNDENLVENLRILAILDSAIKKIENKEEVNEYLKRVYDYYQKPVANLSTGQLSIAALYGYLQQQKIEQEIVKKKIK